MSAYNLSSLIDEAIDLAFFGEYYRGENPDPVAVAALRDWVKDFVAGKLAELGLANRAVVLAPDARRFTACEPLASAQAPGEEASQTSAQNDQSAPGAPGAPSQ
ncbi:hypothetical protein N0V85_006591 [Neurospora sp. IMI 360204]|nr:hypothetical protein N0V85_006591 [Neurospora sp. IMI 360204]